MCVMRDGSSISVDSIYSKILDSVGMTKLPKESEPLVIYITLAGVINHYNASCTFFGVLRTGPAWAAPTSQLLRESLTYAQPATTIIGLIC